MKAWIFTIALAILSAIASLFLKPEQRITGAALAAAQMEFENYTVYAIAESGVESVLSGAKGRHFADREEMEKPVATRIAGGVRDAVSGDFGVLRGDILTLTKNALYRDDLNRTLRTDRAEYNKASGILKGNGGFVLETPEGLTRGASFVADTVKKTITAENIKAKLYEK